MYISKPKSDFILPPAGSFASNCFQVIDLGTQATNYQGQADEKHLIRIAWEMPDELIPSGSRQGQPFTIAQKFTFSMHEKASLRKLLESWRGKSFSDVDFEGPPNGFSTEKLIAAPGLINIMHKSSEQGTFANVAGITRLPKGMQALPLVNKATYFDLNAFNRSVFDGLPQYLKDTIAMSPEFKIATGQKAAAPPQSTGPDHAPDDYDDQLDDLPF